MKWLFHLAIFAAFILVARNSPAAVRIDVDPVASAAGYNFHFGTNSRSYSLSYSHAKPNITLDLPVNVKWFCAVTAVGTNRLESDYSAEISFTLTNASMVLSIISSTDATAPRASWVEVATVPIPVETSARFYALRLAPVASAIPNSRLQITQTAGSRRGKR